MKNILCRALYACAAAVLIALASPQTAPAGGRWVMHLLTQAPTPGSVGKPVDTFSLPDTAGHWVWLVWFDLSAGRWTYDTLNPYFYSVNGTVDFQIPAFSQWYYLLFYDTVTGVWH